MKWRSKEVVITAVVAVAVIAGLAAYLAVSSSNGSSTGTVQVVGSGSVSGTPDTLTLTLDVTTNASTATKALTHNNEQMATLQQTLESAGVASHNLSTSDLDLSPNYNSNGAVTGYGVDDELIATLTDLHDAGSVIDKAADSVGNDVQIEGLSFSLSKTSGLRQSARINAMQDAEHAAQALANASGAHLGAVLKITDNEQVTSPTPPLPEFAANTAARSAAVPVQAGSEQVQDQVTVVYDLNG